MLVLWVFLLYSSCYMSSTFGQGPGKIVESGFSDQYKSENTLGEYIFGYNEDHTSGGSFRRETSDRFGNKIGSYGLRIGDGRVRVVNYIADSNGFRADISSNEPGMESQNGNNFLKIAKKNMYSVLIPGFEYSGNAPHVTFESDQLPSAVHEEHHKGEVDYSSMHLNEDEIGSVYPNEDHSIHENQEHENQMPIDDNIHDTYTDEEEVFNDDFGSDEYGYASEMVAQNQTTHEIQKNIGSFQPSEPVFQGTNQHAIKVSPSSGIKNEPQESQETDRIESNYQPSVNKDLQPLHSTDMKVSESSESFTKEDISNATDIIPDAR